jgi:hypothetical protein
MAQLIVANDMGPFPFPNTIHLPDPGAGLGFRLLDPQAYERAVPPDQDGRFRWVGTRDASWLEFVVEELLGHSAARVALEHGNAYYSAVPLLPRALRGRAIQIDPSGEAAEMADAVLNTISDEGLSTWDLEHSLSRLLLGLKCRVQVEVDPAEMLQAVEKLRDEVMTSDARATLAVIQGIVRTYEPVEMPVMVFRPGAASDQSRLFARFVEDSTYREITREAGMLGIPTHMTMALIRLRRLVEDFMSKPRVEDSLELGFQSVQVATHIPTTKVGALGRLVAKANYMPPLVSLDEIRKRANSAWLKAKPPFVPLDPKLAGVPPLDRSRRDKP